MLLYNSMDKIDTLERVLRAVRRREEVATSTRVARRVCDVKHPRDVTRAQPRYIDMTGKALQVNWTEWISLTFPLQHESESSAHRSDLGDDVERSLRQVAHDKRQVNMAVDQRVFGEYSSCLRVYVCGRGGGWRGGGWCPKRVRRRGDRRGSCRA